MKKKSAHKGYDISWEPHTLKDYMDIAQAHLKFDEVFDLFPELVNAEVYARRALEEGITLIKFFRAQNIGVSEGLSGEFETEESFVFWEVSHKWALGLCRLWIYISEILRALDNPPCDEYWPRRPGIEGLGEVGRAALEVVELFACLVGDIAYDALKSASGTEESKDLIYDFIENESLVLEPKLEPKALRWREGLKEALAKAYPSSRWPEVLLDRDSKRLAIVLDCELKEALKAEKHAKKPVCGNARSEQVETAELCHGAGLAATLEHRDAFMSSADLASLFDVEPEVLRKRLDRRREKRPLDSELYVESEDRGLRKAKYLYNVRLAAKIVERLKRANTSAERPPERKPC